MKPHLIACCAALASVSCGDQSAAVSKPAPNPKTVAACHGLLPSHFNEVRKLLDELPRASPERQSQIFQSLENLGTGGVQAIVAQMDDRTPLVDPRISLLNHSPDAFEGIRHYGPELVVDALDAILNQITGEGGNIVNGGSEQQRRKAVADWQTYATTLKCS